MRRIMTTLLVALLGIGAAACGSSDGGNRVSTRSIPSGPDDLVIRVDTRGGFTSVESQLAIVPELSIFGDGRVIVTGPVTQQYPPHALPNLQTGRLSRATLERLVRRAADAGLVGPAVDYGRPSITDMPTTEITVDAPQCSSAAACAAPHPQHIYALSAEPVHGDPGLTAGQVAARRRANAWLTAANAAAQGAATTPYVPTEVAVYVRPMDAQRDDLIQISRVAWPGNDLATFGDALPSLSPYRCGVLTGASATSALAAADRATSLTRWTSGPSGYAAVWRPLLPDEHRCPDVATG